MSIQLGQEERGYLEQLVRRPMKPTRRQKANALLRLAEGDTPEKAAQYAGIPKEAVETLVTRFAESGLAGIGLSVKPRSLIRLVRPGFGVQKYYLLNGTTLGDLLRRSHAMTADQTAYVDGVVADESVPLRDGSVVMIVPQLGNGAVDEPWRATVPSFQDDELFEQYRAILKARRRDLCPDEDPEA
jgi:Homeodomain-like domain